MQVIRAKTAGFCMGVGLALEKLDNALKKRGKDQTICTLGPLIHNPQVLADYAERGVECVEDAAAPGPGTCVVIRAHGIPRETEDLLRSRGVQVVDATCPKVKKAQLAIANATADGAALILFGESDHPEVRGLVSYARGPAYVVGSRDALESLSIPEEHGVILASQTTQDKEIFLALRAAMTERFPGLRVLSTICDATRERQDEARAIAGRVDIMVVVGGRQSGNTRRLADVASSCGIETLLVETADELDRKKFLQKCRAGLTAGASTPKSLIDKAEETLAAW